MSASTSTPSTTQSSSLIERFNGLKVKLNHEYLLLIHKLSLLLEDEEPDGCKDKAEYQAVKARMTATVNALQAVYSKRFYEIERDPSTPVPAMLIHATFAESLHKLLLSKDQRLFDPEYAVFDKMFNTRNISARLLYDALSDGTDCDESVPVQDRDGKDQLWTMLISSYRLAVLFSIYSKNSHVKEVIDIILAKIPNLSASNVMSSVMSMFVSDSRLRKLIFRIMRSKDVKIEQVMTSLQQVLSSLQTGKSSASGSSSSPLIPILKLESKSPEVQGKVLKALEQDDEKQLLELYEGDQSTVSSILALYKAVKDQIQPQDNQGSDLSNLGQVTDTVGKLFAAIETKDDEKIKAVLMESKSLFGDKDIGSFEEQLKNMDAQLKDEEEEFEKDSEEETDLNEKDTSKQE